MEHTLFSNHTRELTVHPEGNFTTYPLHYMEIVRTQAQQAHAQAQVNGQPIVYPNQKTAADQVIQYIIKEGTPLVNLIAQPGVGKTGTFLEVAIQATTHPDPARRIDVEDLFIITGMSDTDWVKQTTQRMIPVFRPRVFHRTQLIREATRYVSSNRPRTAPKLIIIDESHIAAKPGMTIHSFINTIIQDISTTSDIQPHHLTDNQVYILAVSATPGAMLAYPLVNWHKALHRYVTIVPSHSYHGFRHMIQQRRVYKSKSLENTSFQRTLFAKMRHFREPRYHIFRQTTGGSINFYEHLLRLTETELSGWRVLKHDATSRISKIDAMLNTPPPTHTIIIIKGFWRASKRLTQDWIGITYDPPVTRVNVSAVIQGLIGRFCDNSTPRWLHNPDIQSPIHIVPDGAVRQYLRWIDSEFKESDGGIRHTFIG